MTGAVILAGGKGTRMSADVKKQYLKLYNEYIFMISLNKMIKAEKVDIIVVVIPEEDEKFIKNILNQKKYSDIKIAYSGKRRQDSVFNGLKKLKSIKHRNIKNVLIHDGVRPFFTQKMIKNGLKELADFECVIPGIKVKDTIKKKQKDHILKTLNRDKLVAVQTPQFFDFKKLYNFAEEHKDYDYTDESYLFELQNEKISIIMGEEGNIKLTTQFDMNLARFLINEGMINV